MRWHLLLILGLTIALSACRCENGDKVETQYRSIFYDEKWYGNPEDTLLDGATRVSTSTSKNARSLILRCFKFKDDPDGNFDLRYEISVPFLARAVPEIERAGDLELVVSVDGAAIGSYKAIVAKHDFGISFLASVPSSLLEKLGSAQKKIVVMPRQENKSQDEVIEFGVADLSKHIGPVKAACKDVRERAMIQAAFETKDYTRAIDLQQALLQSTEKDEIQEKNRPGLATAIRLLGLSWYQLFAKQFQAALETSDRAMALAPDQIIFASNKAHALMFLGRADEARTLYLKYKGQSAGLRRLLWEDEIRKDFTKMETAGLTHPQMARIRAVFSSAHK
jgi:tetratricopeptide (TPR) repeat protein